MGNPRTFWTKDLLQAELKPLCLKLGHFPSSSELREHGRNDLACAISRHGGFIELANLLGYDRVQSDSDFGWAGETAAIEIISRAGFSVEARGGVKSPHDLIIESVLRVDVKTANYAEYGACRGWFYRIGKVPQADLIFLLQMDTKIFFAVPWYAAPRTNITIARDGGKYAKYQNNWSVIRRMVAMRTAEKAIETETILEVA